MILTSLAFWYGLRQQLDDEVEKFLLRAEVNDLSGVDVLSPPLELPKPNIQFGPKLDKKSLVCR